MAFLKFGNYSKEGPGVSKNEKPKKSFFYFFDILKEKYWNIIKLILLYILCCIPVVTIGCATGGLIYVLRNYVTRQPVMMKSDFFGAFKRNWKQLTGIFLINVVFYAIAGFSLYMYYNAFSNTNGIIYFIGMVVVLSAIVVSLFMNFYINLMIVTFDFSFKKVIKNSFIFAGIGLIKNIINILILLLFATIFFILTIIHPIFSTLFLILVAMPICFLAIVFNTFPIIRKHVIDPYYAEKGIENPLDKYNNNNDKERIFSDTIKKEDDIKK